jgi:hypothetical protein
VEKRGVASVAAARAILRRADPRSVALRRDRRAPLLDLRAQRGMGVVACERQGPVEIRVCLVETSDRGGHEPEPLPRHRLQRDQAIGRGDRERLASGSRPAQRLTARRRRASPPG